MAYQAPTAGTRIAVWLFPALTIYLGGGYLFADRIHFTSPAFTAAKDVMPLRQWGVVFLLVAGVKVAALLADRVQVFIGAMCLGIGLYLVWAFLFALAYFADAHTSPAAPAWPLFVAAMHVTLLETLTGGAMAAAVGRLRARLRSRGRA